VLVAGVMAALMACVQRSAGQGASQPPGELDSGPGRLLARPSASADGEPFAAGLQRLDLAGDREALLYVPPGLPPGPVPLVLALHGAGGTPGAALAPLLPAADERGLLLLALKSAGPTWDVVRGGFGPDVTFADAALATVFARQAVDPGYLTVEGFSDGASYALSLGLTNGDLFSHVIAFSPGFSVPAEERGRPRVFVSHGSRDDVLPLARTSRRIVPALERAGYAVRYEEFAGGHVVPEEIVRAAVAWLLEGDS
jgi:predicted esterase